MDIRISYSKTQFEKAVQFIANNNQHFKGQKNLIRESILEYMEKMAADPNRTFMGTMGFILIADRELEDMDNDENVIRIDINVDPGLGNDNIFSEDDIIDNVINVPF